MFFRMFRLAWDVARPRPVRCVVVEGGVVTMTSLWRVDGAMLVHDDDPMPPVGARVLEGIAAWSTADGEVRGARLGDARRRPLLLPLPGGLPTVHGVRCHA